MDTPQKISLAELSCGAAEDLFAAALKQTLASIDDVNTDWKGKREITLRFRFKTDEQRKNAAIAIECSTKLPSVKPVIAMAHIGRHKGELVMVEAYRQEDLFADPIGRPAAVANPTQGG